MLLQHGADVDCRRPGGSNIPSTPVNTAVRYHEFQVLKTILLHGATVNYRGVFNPLPPSPFSIILKKNWPIKYAEILLEFGCLFDEDLRLTLSEGIETDLSRNIISMISK